MGWKASPVELIAETLASDSNPLGFRLAGDSDDAELRRLLRTNRIGGDIALSLEREPGFFLGAGIEGPEHHTIVATRNGRIVAMGSISERERFLNGVPARVGYLGGLRMDASCRGQASILRRGYGFFRLLHGQGSARIYLTSIVADNIAARRILERGLPGMPVYRSLEPFTTLVSRVRRVRSDEISATRADRYGITLHPGSPESVGEIVSLLNESNRRYQFAPRWTAQDLLSPDRCPGLRPEDFRLAWRGPTLVGCAALWDQRALKQTVLRQYSSRIDCWRRLARILPGVPKLPEPGSMLAHGYVSHIATAGENDWVLALLIESLFSRARSRGLEYLTLGFASRDPRLAMIRRSFGGRIYLSILYTVYWPEDRDAAEALDGRAPAPEVAVL